MLLESDNLAEASSATIADAHISAQTSPDAGEIDDYQEVLALAKVLLKEQVEKLSPEDVDYTVDWKKYPDIFHHAVAGTLEEVLDDIDSEFNDHIQNYHSREWLDWPMSNAIRLALDKYSETHTDFDKHEMDIDDLESDLHNAFDEYECGDEPGYALNITDEAINIVLRLNNYEYYQYTKDMADICSLLGLNLREFLETQISFDVRNYQDDQSRCMVEEAKEVNSYLMSNDAISMIDLDQDKSPVLDGLSEQEVVAILESRQFDSNYRQRLISGIRDNHENHQDQISIAIKLDLDDLKKINEMVKSNIAYSITIKNAAIDFLDTMNGSAADDIKIPHNLVIPSCFFERIEKDTGCVVYVDGTRGYGVEDIYSNFYGGKLISVNDARLSADEAYIDPAAYLEMTRQHRLIGSLIKHDVDATRSALAQSDDMFDIGNPLMNWGPMHYSALGFLLNKREDDFYDRFKAYEQSMFEFNKLLIAEGAHPDDHVKQSGFSPAKLLPRYSAGAIATYIKHGANKSTEHEEILALLESEEERQEVAAIVIMDEFENEISEPSAANGRRLKMI